MSLALACVFAAAIFFGIGAVLQASAARTMSSARRGLDPALLWRLLGRRRFLAGLAADFAGYLAMLVALRLLPLFLVQGAVAGSLAVTAVIAGRWLRIRLRPAEWTAVAMVCLGLVLLAVSAGAEGAKEVGTGFRVGLIVAVCCLVLVAALASRLPGRLSTPVLGAVAGLGFGVVGLASRVHTGFDPAHLLADPAGYIIVGTAPISVLCFATALQRGSVTVATAALTVGQTVVPATIGVLLLGDEPRAGFAWLAVVGFLTALSGALALARFGEIDVGAHRGRGTLARTRHR